MLAISNSSEVFYKVNQKYFSGTYQFTNLIPISKLSLELLVFILVKLQH